MSQVTVTGSPAVGTDRGRLAARVAGWSARHRMLALGGWLLLVAGVFLVGGQLGTKSLPSFDPGQAGQAERVLNRPDVFQRPAESVLIQARSAGQTVATDPELRQTTAEVMAASAALPGAAADIRSPQAGGGHDLRGRPVRAGLLHRGAARLAAHQSDRRRRPARGRRLAGATLHRSAGRGHGSIEMLGRCRQNAR
jgi:putative drug exporter of the RND superfamily